MSKFPQPPAIHLDDLEALDAWAKIEPEDHPLMAAGARRNVLRHAEAWGPHLIARLVADGYLQSGQNPLEALEDVLALANGDI